MHEPFGPEYVRPPQKDCPHCPCCTEALCERGRASVMECVGLTAAEHKQTVYGCPCSAATTPCAASWRAAQVRVTRLARELPISGQAEALLRALAAGGDQARDDGTLFPQLTVRGLAQLDGERPVITELGVTYLAARDDVRLVAVAHVVDIDAQARTARVEVPAWRAGEPVTVLLDQVVADTGLDAGDLPGQCLQVEANCHAAYADQLVLTGFRDAEQPADGDA